MKSESRECQNCKSQFTIEPEDFNFYEKISVPPPTFCPQCRMQQYMAVRNERTLYRDACDLCKKAIVSVYAPEKPFLVYCRECWYSDKWDPLSFGKPYDFGRPFLEQFYELMRVVPRLQLHSIHTNVNVEYANFVAGVKNVYLSYSIVDCENVYYSRLIDKARDIFDSFLLAGGEQNYEAVDSVNLYYSHFTIRSRECIDSSFLFDCVNCQHCFMSANLRNKRFVIRNREYAREEYEREMRKINMGSVRELENLRREFQALIQRSLHRYGNLIKTVECTGDNLRGSKNAKYCFEGYGGENIKYCSRFINLKDSYDIYGSGEGELCYGVSGGGFGGYNSQYIVSATALRNTKFTDWCQESSYLFGCIGIRKKNYCILNKQYAKEEYGELLPRIEKHIEEMPYRDSKGRRYGMGEFFPVERSPFAYNESMVQDYFPLTKAEALSKGYAWRDPDPPVHTPTLPAAQIPDEISEVKDSITREIIGCAACGRAYRILEPELAFLREHKIALPRKCQECRYRDRFNLRNPLKLWHRQCLCDYVIYPNTAKHAHHPSGRCPNEFETSYAPDRPEIVYCEQCYNTEVV